MILVPLAVVYGQLGKSILTIERYALFLRGQKSTQEVKAIDVRLPVHLKIAVVRTG
jgi:hypothetical protein